MIGHKVQKVPDSVCKECYQSYEDICRAFLIPHSDEEKEHRLKGGALCARPKK